jgi:hypothetical protein
MDDLRLFHNNKKWRLLVAVSNMSTLTQHLKRKTKRGVAVDEFVKRRKR